MKLLIAVHHPFDQWNAPAWFSERLRSEFRELDIVHLPDYKRLDAEIPAPRSSLPGRCRPEQILAARRLRWIHSPAAAVHQLMFPELIQSDIVLTNAREVHGPVVAEHVIALIFALAKKIPGSVQLQQKHVWGQQILWDELPRVREVAGATLGLVGSGFDRPACRQERESSRHACNCGARASGEGKRRRRCRLWPRADRGICLARPII